MTKTKVMDLTMACQSFPELPMPEIHRENILDTIDTLFEQGNELVVIEGEEGIGKTILLAQFVRRYPDHTLSLFIRPTSRLAYDPDVLRFDLCNQLEWALHQTELQTMQEADDTFLRDRLIKLRQRARHSKETFYFVVDGLADVPEGGSQILRLVLDMLPLGFTGFHFLFSGDSEHLSAYIPKGVSVKPFPLSSFSLSQAMEYFENLDLDLKLVEEIRKTFRGIPGNLASVGRILQSGVDIQTFLEDMPDRLPDLFDYEWRTVDCDNEKQLTLLAVLAHDRRSCPHSIDGITRLLDLEKAKVLELVRDLSFVVVDPESNEVGFVSETFRKYADNRLRHLRRKVNDYIISDLLREPGSRSSLDYLPDRLEQAGRFDDLLDYLSPDNFIKILEYNQSLVPVKQKAELGVSAARRLKKDGHLMRFSLQRSVITELDGAEIWRSEIEARMALNDYEAALVLAQSTVLREDRLHLLAVIARAKREQGLSPEPELQEQIRQLYNQIDQYSLGDRAIEIACDLVYSNQELAIELVEKATGAEVEEKELDWALAKLSVAALGADEEQPEAFENVRGRIKDPQARRFSIEASLMLEEYSADEVIAEVEKNAKAKDRLYLLRRWAMKNREGEDAAKVVEFAFNLAINMSPDEYVPARDLRQIASPLPFISDESKAMQLVGGFDGQLGLVERLGPTEDYIRLQLLLAQAESKYDFDAARNRVFEIYLYTLDLEDLAVKTACLARLVAALPGIDSKKLLEVDGGREDRIHTSAEGDFESSTEQLLEATADHYQVARGIIRALSKTKPNTALELALKLNTETRRDRALVALTRSAIQLPINRVNLVFLREVVGHFVDLASRDQAVVSILERLSQETELSEPTLAEALPFIGRIESIQDAGLRCQACCLAHPLLAKYEKHAPLTNKLLSLLQKAWQAIDVGWHKIDTGFKIVSALASSSPETSREYLELTEELRDEILLDAGTTALTYLVCIQLAIRAYSGLLPGNLDTKEDLVSLAELINYVPSAGERAVLWAQLALHFYTSKRLENCRRVVSEHVRPLLQNIPEDDAEYRATTIVTAAPALYCAHPTTALELISGLSCYDKDAAYARICLFLLRKQPVSEPYDASPGMCYDAAYEEIIDICDLLQKMDSDSMIYYFIECIADSVVHRRREKSFPKEQKSRIVAILKKVVDSKLPNPRYIKHDGYRIIAQAQINRMRNTPTNEWLELVDLAHNNIRNLADQATVLSRVAVAMPNREATRRNQILDEALEIIEKIPANLDRIQHYESVASITKRVNLGLAKKCLKRAMDSAVESDDPDLYPVQRRLVDLADALGGEDFAASFAASLDDDPARTKTHSNLERRLEILRLRKSIANRGGTSRDLTSSPESMYPQAAWMLLGRLNAGQIAPFHIDYTRDFVEIAAGFPLRQSYPILAWVIENAKARYANTDQALTYIRPMYDAALLGAQLAARMATRSSEQLKRAKLLGSQSSASKYGVVRAGDREEVIQLLRDWFEHEVRNYLKICDAYFGPEDLEVLQLLQSVNPICKVQILTSQEHHREVPKPWEDTYRDYWRFEISLDQEPPETDIIIVGTKSKKSPIHDRWWLTRDGGIRMGNSFHQLGLGRTSEISTLTKEEAEMREKEVDQYLYRLERKYEGERLQYNSFTL